MHKLTVNHHNGSYDVIIKRDVIKHLEDYIDLNHKVLIVTDTGVPAIYANSIASKCLSPYIFTFERGEKNKNMSTLTKILKAMSDYGFTRTDILIACGGGVCGDMGGLAASLYMRGIKFYNVPTTLLSQVDSSIGGKCAIDFEGYKNIVGAFYQPSGVFIDANTLKTLDIREVHAGLVEAIKMSATFNEDLFNFIASSQDLDEAIDEIIYQSLKIKQMVVEEDPLEKGLRKVLNFGHTFGHAIESKGMGKYLHGEAVGLGMLYVSRGEVYDKLYSVLTKYNVPTKIEDSKQSLVEYLKHDKKMKGDVCSLILCPKIGTYEISEVKLIDLIK